MPTVWYSARMRPFSTIIVLVVGLCVQSMDAQGYAMRLHEVLTERALADSAWLLRAPKVRAATMTQLNAYRLWFYSMALEHPDKALTKRFKERYPTVKEFTATAFRELLAFNINPGQRIYGIDRVERRREWSSRRLLSWSSSVPDRDGRNRERIAIDPKTRKPMTVGDGQLVPLDPSILNMGNLKGLSSQAHAHYGLPDDLEFSADPAVLQADPKRFAMKAGYADGPILTLAAEMTQMHVDLAILAHLWGGKGSNYLTLAFIGHAFHYLQDVGNQIHTVQVGSYGFFLSAKLQYWWRALITGGGYWTELRKFTSIGIDILKNHHVLIEQLTSLRFVDALKGQSSSPEIQKSVDELDIDEPTFSKALDLALTGGKNKSNFAEAITKALVKVSAPEGPQAYELMRNLACGRVSLYGFRVPDDTDKGHKVDYDTLLCDVDMDENQQKLSEFYGLQAKAFSRVTTAQRRMDRELAAVVARKDRVSLRNEIMGRFLKTRLDLIDAADARRKAWLANPPESSSPVVTSVGWLIGDLVALFLFVWFVYFKCAPKPAPIVTAEVASE